MNLGYVGLGWYWSMKQQQPPSQTKELKIFFRWLRLMRGLLTILFFLLSLGSLSYVAPSLGAKLSPPWVISPSWHYPLWYHIKCSRGHTRNRWPSMRLSVPLARLPQCFVEAVASLSSWQLKWRQPPYPYEVSNPGCFPTAVFLSFPLLVGWIPNSSLIQVIPTRFTRLKHNLYFLYLSCSSPILLKL